MNLYITILSFVELYEPGIHFLKTYRALLISETPNNINTDLGVQLNSTWIELISACPSKVENTPTWQFNELLTLYFIIKIPEHYSAYVIGICFLFCTI